MSDEWIIEHDGLYWDGDDWTEAEVNALGFLSEADANDVAGTLGITPPPKVRRRLEFQ